MILNTAAACLFFFASMYVKPFSRWLKFEVDWKQF